MTVAVGMPGISHLSSTKRPALAMLHHPQKDPYDMWAMPDEEVHDSLLNLMLNKQRCDVMSDCINAKKTQLCCSLPKANVLFLLVRLCCGGG